MRRLLQAKMDLPVDKIDQKKNGYWLLVFMIKSNQREHWYCCYEHQTSHSSLNKTRISKVSLQVKSLLFPLEHPPQPPPALRKLDPGRTLLSLGRSVLSMEGVPFVAGLEHHGDSLEFPSAVSKIAAEEWKVYEQRVDA